MFFKRKKKRRALILGLDGVPKTLIERFARDGTMPFLGELFPTGVLHQTRVSLPEVSNVNWSSFMTGVNPGRHGIFGFTDLKPHTYEMIFPSFPQLKADTLWDELGRHGKRSLVINQPGCYPVRDIPGAIVSGFVAVNLKRAVSPVCHLAALEGMGYRLDVDTRGCHTDSDKLFRELDLCLTSRQQAFRYFIEQEEWDCVELIITGTDRLQHFLWSSCIGDGPEQARARAYYHACDALCREVVQGFYGASDPDGLFLLSDHGFCQLESEFQLNVWLRQEGYLRFAKDPPDSYQDLTEETVAFAMDPGRIYLHRKGRYPKGRVEDDQVLTEIRAKLTRLEHDGRPVFERIWHRDEIYSGPETGHGPDLLCTPRRGLDVKGAIKKPDLFSPSIFTGMHTWDDAFFWAGGGYGVDLRIHQLRQIIVDSVLG